jgi:two-component system nitrogen regulation response regulator GlnG
MVFTIHLPPLRERPGDVPLLVEHFVKLLSLSMGKRVRSVAPEAMRLLEAYEWPGNVRELQNAIKYALVHAPGEVLTTDCLPEVIQSGVLTSRQSATPSGESLEIGQLVQRLLRHGEPDIYGKVYGEVDRIVLSAVLRHAKGNQVQASQLLGISRNTLRAKLRALGMAVEKQLLPEFGPE